MASADSNDDDDDDDEFREFDDPLVRKFLRRRQRQTGESSVDKDKTVFRQYLPLLGEKSVAEAEYPDVIRYTDQLVDRGCPESTVNGYLSTINRLHQYLNRFHDANMPGVANISDMYNNLNDSHERKPLDRDEVRQLIDATQSLRDALIIGYLYYTGNRASIPAKLKLRDVDLEAGTIFIDNLKNSGEREISIHEDIEFLLRVWLTEEREAYPPAKESPYVFVGEQSAERLCKNRIWNIVHEAANRAGIQEVVGEKADGKNLYKVKTHVLRHSFATHGFEDGMSKKELAAFLGQEKEQSVEVYIESDKIDEAVKAYNTSYEGI